MEFRTFVVGGQCTAISQYYSTLFFAQLAEKKRWLEEVIIQTLEQKIWPRLQGRKEFERIVLDVLVNEKERSCTVIELNPFSEATHACLFDWATEREQLTGATKKFEFRLLERPIILTKADKMVLNDFLK
jgi:hypothetical protein